MDGQGLVVCGLTKTGGVWMNKDWWCMDGQGLVVQGLTRTGDVWMDNDW